MKKDNQHPKKVKEKIEHLKNSKKNSPGCKPDTNKTATTRDLKKVLIYLGSVESDSITSIGEHTGVNMSRLEDALVFLTNNNILIKRLKHKSGNTFCYILNPLFRSKYNGT